MNKKMKLCKVCGAEVAKSAKVCPKCGAKLKGSSIIGKIFGAVLIVVGLSCLIVDGSADGAVKDAVNEVQQEKYEIIGDINTYFDGFGWYAEGILKNNTNKDISYLQIEFNLYDSDNNSLGIAMANTNHIEAGGTWKFKAIDLTSYSSEIDHYEVGEITAW